MKTLKYLTIGLAALALTAAGALAGDWHRCGDYRTGGGAKEVSANFRHARTVQIQCLDGGVNIQTLWVRNGGQKREVRVAHAFRKGEKMDIDLGGQDVTGFRISDSGNGTYRIHVYADDDRDYDRHGRHDRHDDRYDDRYDRRDYRDRRDHWDRRDYDYDDDWDRRPPPPPRRRDDDYRDRPPSWWPW